MKVKNVNSSSKKTNKRIKETFALLLKEKKSLDNITVTELCKLADITRSAFYTHYESIYDVAQELNDETTDVLMKNINEIHSTEDFDRYIDSIFEYIKENENIYAMLLSSNDPLMFSSRLSRYINNHLTIGFKDYKREDLKLTIPFFADGCINLIIKYFRKEIDSNLDELNAFVKDAFRKVIN